MKNLKKIVLILLISSISISFGQTKLPSVKIKDLNNQQIDTKSFGNDGKPFVISFWATWCKPCLQEMMAMNENFETWQKELGFKLYSISIDDSRNSKKVAPFVKGKDWKFTVLLDENSDFRRAMNVNNPPHTFLVNGKGEIVWSHIGYAPGDEEELLAQYRKLVQDSK